MATVFEQVKANLIAVLADKDQKVVALKGDWGTGKTHLWKNISYGLGSLNFSSTPIYVSLFGVKSAKELKLRVLQNAYMVDESTIQNLAKTGGNFLQGFLQRFVNGAALESVLLWLPKVTGGRLIVIDDIERKHKSFEIDEFLGFLDEYSEIHNTRFLVLLNSDKLADGDIWAAMHEKVIDAEITLAPTARDCLAVVAKFSEIPFPEITSGALETLGITNIRVIRKIIKTIHKIKKVGAAHKLELAARWVPSTVLLTAAHYKAVKDAPTIDYLRGYNGYGRLFPRGDEGDNAEGAKWAQLLEKLGINSIDSFEELLYRYLNSGLYDPTALAAVFQGYDNELKNMAAEQALRKFITANYWDAHSSNADLLNMARELLPSAAALSAAMVSDVAEIVRGLGDVELENAFIGSWLASNDHPELAHLAENPILVFPERPLHPSIVAKIEAARKEVFPQLTLREVVARIRANSGWGERERAALRSSSADQYLEELRLLKNAELRHFLDEHLRWVTHDMHDADFAVGRDHFLDACRTIVQRDAAGRLAQILIRSFQSVGQSARLD